RLMPDATAEDRPEDGKRRSRELNERLARPSDRQYGGVSIGPLRKVGFTDNEIEGRSRRRLLLPLHRGVFMVGRRRLPDYGHLHGALLAMKAPVFLSHPTAVGVRRWR